MNLYKDCNSLNPIEFSISSIECEVGRQGLSSNLNELRFTDNKLKRTSYDVIIVGSGIHGCTIACHLKKQFPKFNILLIDKNDFLCEQFFQRTKSIGQRTLRSPYQHQIAPDHDLQLIDFARLKSKHMSGYEKKQLELAITGQRSIVPLDFFWAHLKHTLMKYAVHLDTIKSEVDEIQQNKNSYCIKTNQGLLRSRYIIQATGSDSYVPEFAVVKKNIFHAYDLNLKDLKNKRIAIIGNGLTAATLVHNLHSQNSLVWILRSSETYKCTDVLPRYFRTEGVSEFTNENELKRKEILAKENSASIMPEFKDYIDQLEKDQKIRVHRGVQNISLQESEEILLELNKEDKTFCDTLILATGLKTCKEIVGFEKRFTSDLEFVGSPNAYATGKIVEDVIGPAAKNFDGARIALKKIISNINLKENVGKKYNPKGTLAIK